MEYKDYLSLHRGDVVEIDSTEYIVTNVFLSDIDFTIITDKGIIRLPLFVKNLKPYKLKGFVSLPEQRKIDISANI